jgi:hypothetical protein
MTFHRKQYLLEFETFRWVHILKLVQNTINNRHHSGISNLKPVEAHFDTHCAAYLARKNVIINNAHQTKARSLFHQRQDKDEIPILGDKVLLELKKKCFQKESSFSSPNYSPGKL